MTSRRRRTRSGSTGFPSRLYSARIPHIGVSPEARTVPSPVDVAWATQAAADPPIASRSWEAQSSQYLASALRRLHHGDRSAHEKATRRATPEAQASDGASPHPAATL